MIGGTGIWWAGLNAVARDKETPARFAAVRSTGFQPDVYTITVLESQFREILPKLPKGLLDNLPTGDQSPTNRNDLRKAEAPSSAVDALPLAALPARGDLLLVQERANPGQPFETREVRLKDIFLREVRPLDEFSPRLLSLELADVRSFWKTHGEVTARWNVPAEDGLDSRWNPSGEATPLREILAALCKALPGQPELVRCPDVEAVLAVKAPRVECWGANPAEALEQLCEAFGLTFALDLAGTASIYWRGEGTVGDHGEIPAPSGENARPHEPPESVDKGAWANEVMESRVSRRVPAAVPDQVQVIGGPSIWTVAIDYLEPVISVLTIHPETGQSVRRWVEVTPSAIGELIRLNAAAPVDQQQTGGQATGQFKGGQTSIAVPNAGPGGTTISGPAVAGSSVPATQTRARKLGSTKEAPKPSTAPAGEVSLEWLLNLPFSREDPFSPSSVKAMERARETTRILYGDDAALGPPAAPAGLNEELFRTLQRDMFRFWRVPRAYRHLLPILPRAERYPNGKRHAPSVEAFGCGEKEVEFKGEPITDHEMQRKEAARRAWQAKRNQIAEAKGKLQALRDLSGPEVIEWLGGIVSGDFHRFGSDPKRYVSPLDYVAPGLAAEAMNAPGVAGGAARVLNGLAIVATEGSAPGQIVQGCRYIMKGALHEKQFVVQTSGGDVDAGKVMQSLYRWGKRAATQTLGLDPPAIDVEMQELEKRIEQFEAESLELQKEWDTPGTINEQIVQVRAELRASEFTSASQNASLRAKLKKLEEERDAEYAKWKELQKPHMVWQPANFPRVEVASRVADEHEGVFELEEAAFWLDDLTVPVGAALAIPMPVRATFGTRHEPPFPLSAPQRSAQTLKETVTFGASKAAKGAAGQPVAVDDEAMNELVRRAFEALVKEPELARFAASTGHLVPAAGGGAQARWGFKVEGTKAVPAEVPAYAYRILAPELRLEVGLGGVANLATITPVAKALAEAAMGLPAFKGTQTRKASPQVLEGGYLTVEGPRSVNPNGRVSSVEWILGQDGAGIDTRVNLDAPSDPLPGVAPGLGLLGKPLTFRFGLDPDTLDER